MVATEYLFVPALRLNNKVQKSTKGKSKGQTGKAK